ncbi:MAG: DUF4282 domain-containing protein [Acidithiobacillus sp.]
MLKDMLSFNEMLTPKLINFFYWLALGVDVIVGLGIMTGGGVIYVLLGLLSIVIAAVFIRIGFELMILAFRMYDELKEINANTHIPK